MTNWRAWRGPLAPIAIALAVAAVFLGAGLFDDTEPRASFVDAGPAQGADPAPPAAGTSSPAKVTHAAGNVPLAPAPGLSGGTAPGAVPVNAATTAGVPLSSPPPTMPDLAETTPTKGIVKGQPPGEPPAPPTLAPHLPLVVKPVDDEGHPHKPTIFGVTYGGLCDKPNNFAMSAAPTAVMVVCSLGVGDDVYRWRPL